MRGAAGGGPRQGWGNGGRGFVSELCFRTELIGRVLFARWVAAPSAEDVAAMEVQLVEAMQRAAGPVIFVASVDSRMRMPNAEQRGHLNRLARAMRRYCQTAHLIVEGSELQGSMLRVIVSGVLISTRMDGAFLSVHQGVDSAVREVTSRLEADGEALFRQARQLGLLDWGEPLRASSA